MRFVLFLKYFENRRALCGSDGDGTTNVTDEARLIREYFIPILEGTLPCLTSRHWRDRLSACLALDDLLLLGRKASEVLPFVERLWAGKDSKRTLFRKM